MKFQAWQYVLVTIVTIWVLGALFAFFREPAGPLVELLVEPLQIIWMAILKMCLRAADRMEKMGADVFISWQRSAEHQFSHGVQPPRYIAYMVKLSAWSAGFLRFQADFLARGIITYRNHGTVLGSWPARSVITPRTLFTGGLGQRVSFTPTWGRSWVFERSPLFEGTGRLRDMDGLRVQPPWGRHALA